MNQSSDCFTLSSVFEVTRIQFVITSFIINLENNIQFEINVTANEKECAFIKMQSYQIINCLRFSFNQSVITCNRGWLLCFLCLALVCWAASVHLTSLSFGRFAQNHGHHIVSIWRLRASSSAKSINLNTFLLNSSGMSGFETCKSSMYDGTLVYPTHFHWWGCDSSSSSSASLSFGERGSSMTLAWFDRLLILNMV